MGLLLSFIGLVAIAACAGGPAVMIPRQEPAALPVLTGALGGNERIVATAQIDVISSRGRFPIRAALILQKPSFIRLEMIPVIGTPDLFLVATPSEMKIFIPSRGEFYLGKPTAANVSHFLPWDLEIIDMVQIFCGDYPLLTGEGVATDIHEEASFTRVSMTAASGESQIVWLTKEGRLLKWVRKGFDGKDLYRALYEEYGPGDRLARKISFQTADERASVSIHYVDMKIETSEDFKIFDLTPPAGSQVIALD